jgi:Ca-activated chloride channel homolog
MPFARLLHLTLPILPLVSSVAPACAQERPQPIRVSVDRVDVGVVVTDANGRLVEGLQHSNFHIFDNGAEQPLTDFAAVDEPAQVLLLLEAGPAVYLFESSHVQAAYALFRGLSPGDRVAIVKYEEAPHPVLDFTSDKQEAAAALSSLQFNLGFGSLNLSSSLARVLEWQSGVQGKKTIVLLSTGIDTSPPSAASRVLQQLKVSDVRVLAVSLAGALQTTGPANKRKSTQKSAQTAEELAFAAQLLQQMAEASGGRAYFPITANDFSAVYTQIAQLVRHEYSLTFAPPAHDGLVHSIKVRVTAPRADASSTATISYLVDHRRAYLAPAPDSSTSRQ